MKKILISAVIILISLTPNKATAQAQEIQQLILNIEKLTQFKQILSDMKKGYQILSGGYKAVKDMSEGNFSLHKTFLDALLQVSPVVKNYKRVGDIVNYQILLVKESKTAFNRFAKSQRFTQSELKYLEKVYANLLGQSLRNLDELVTILSADKLRMSDDERLEAIDKIYADMQDKLLFLRNFNAESNILALQRAKESNDVQTGQGLHELKN
jgi:DNA repair ATPase RecN